MDDVCNIIMNSELSAEFPNIVWQTSSILPPIDINGPFDGQTFCLEVVGENSGIYLDWEPNGASHYLVQLSSNPQFNGPSVREIVVLAATGSEYQLKTPKDIRYGETIYWRVIGADLFNGGVSDKSETRKLTYIWIVTGKLRI